MHTCTHIYKMSVGSKLFSSTLIGGMHPHLSAAVKTCVCMCRCWELLFHIVGTGPHSRAMHLNFLTNLCFLRCSFISVREFLRPVTSSLVC